MRPFRFFFGVALAVGILFFLARFVIFALIAAAILSTIFFVIRGLYSFFMKMDGAWDHRWKGYEESEQPRYSLPEKLFTTEWPVQDRAFRAFENRNSVDAFDQVIRIR